MGNGAARLRKKPVTTGYGPRGNWHSLSLRRPQAVGVVGLEPTNNRVEAGGIIPSAILPL